MTPKPPAPLLALSRDPVTMFAMADAFRKAHDEHAALKIAKIFAAGQREQANIIVGLRAALELLSTRASSGPATDQQDLVAENIAEDSYWAIAEHLGTPSGWSVQEHVWEIRELLQESMFAFGKMGANSDLKHAQRDLWERINASLQGLVHEPR